MFLTLVEKCGNPAHAAFAMLLVGMSWDMRDFGLKVFLYENIGHQCTKCHLHLITSNFIIPVMRTKNNDIKIRLKLKCSSADENKD